MIPRKIIQVDDLDVGKMMDNLEIKEMSIRVEDRTESGLEDTSKRFCNIRYVKSGAKLEKHIGYNLRVDNPITGFDNTPITSERPTHTSFIYLPNSVVEFAIRIINEEKGTDILSSVMHRFSIVKTDEPIEYRLTESLVVPYSKSCCLMSNSDIFKSNKTFVQNIPERNKTIVFIPSFVDSQEDIENIKYYMDNEDLSVRFNCENSFFIPVIYTLCSILELINEHCVCFRCGCHDNC